MPYFFYLIDNSIPIFRLLLYSLSVLILIMMSLPEEQPPFKEPPSPIGRMQLGLAASFITPSPKKPMEMVTNLLMTTPSLTRGSHQAQWLKEGF